MCVHAKDEVDRGEGMIISRTPLRVSFVGGGSDLPAYYRHEPGAVVSTAINKYIYITVNEKFDRQIRASYSVTEIVERVDDLKHQLIREALRLVVALTPSRLLQSPIFPPKALVLVHRVPIPLAC